MAGDVTAAPGRGPLLRRPRDPVPDQAQAPAYRTLRPLKVIGTRRMTVES